MPSAGIRGFLAASDFPTWLKFVRRGFAGAPAPGVLLGGLGCRSRVLLRGLLLELPEDPEGPEWKSGLAADDVRLVGSDAAGNRPVPI